MEVMVIERKELGITKQLTWILFESCDMGWDLGQENYDENDAEDVSEKCASRERMEPQTPPSHLISLLLHLMS